LLDILSGKCFIGSGTLRLKGILFFLTFTLAPEGESVKLRPLCIFLALASSGAASQSFSPLVSYATFRSPGFSSAPGYGASLSVPITGPFRVDVAATFARPAILYDVVGGSTTAAVNVAVLQAAVAVRIAGDDHTLSLSLAGGGGTILSSVPAMTVSLGALGSYRIPERSSGNAFLLGGLRLDIGVAPHVGIVAAPAVRFASLGGKYQTDFSVAGGISVRLFP
jgi:hypothetical protein